VKRASRGRRDFLTSLVWLGALGAHPSRSWATPAARRTSDPVASRLVALLRHPESAVVIGTAYLRLAADERRPDRLARAIESRCGGRVLDGDRDARRRCLSEGVRRDFAEGRVVRIDGWLLSVTEARLCALAALVAHPETAPS
jgi:hypothetical protein